MINKIPEKVYAALVVAPGAILYLFNLTGFPAYMWDEQTYHQYTVFFRMGDFYTFFNQVGHPPLVIIMFSIFSTILPGYLPLRLISSCFSISTAWIIHLTIAKKTSPSWGLAGAYFFLLNPVNLIYGRMALLDAALAFFSCLFLYFVMNYRHDLKKIQVDANMKPGEKDAILKQNHKKHFTRLLFSALGVIFSKITGLYIILVLALLILIPSNRNHVQTKNRSPFHSVAHYILARIRENWILFKVGFCAGLSFVSFFLVRFLYFLIVPPFWVGETTTPGDILDFSFNLGQFSRFTFDWTGHFFVEMIGISAVFSIGIGALILYSLKKKHVELISIGMSCIIVLYASLTVFNYHYVLLVSPFLTISFGMLVAEKRITLLAFLLLNIFSVFKVVMLDYPVLYVILLILSVFLVLPFPILDKTLKGVSRLLNRDLTSRTAFTATAFILLFSSSFMFSFASANLQNENAGYDAIMEEINGNTNATDLVYVSGSFPYQYWLEAKNTNPLSTYNKTTNQYNFSHFRYIVFDQFWVFQYEISQRRQNITALSNAIQEVFNNWELVVSFSPRWSNTTFSPFAPPTGFSMIPHGNVTLFKNPT